MQKGLYRRVPTKMCQGCDHPAYCPSKKVNGKNACRKCRKEFTKSVKKSSRNIIEKEKHYA